MDNDLDINIHIVPWTMFLRFLRNLKPMLKNLKRNVLVNKRLYDYYTKNHTRAIYPLFTALTLSRIIKHQCVVGDSNILNIPHYICNTEDTFLPDFLVILKRILKKCFLVTYSGMNNIFVCQKNAVNLLATMILLSQYPHSAICLWPHTIRSSRNSEANVSEFYENFDQIFSQYYIHDYMYSRF